MEKIGYLIDEKLNKMKSANEAKQKKNEKTMIKYNNIFKRFEDFVDADESVISNRVRILVINLRENRAQGWERTRKMNEEQPKKIEDLRKEEEQKLRLEQQLSMQAEYEEQGYQDHGYSNKRGDRRDQRSGTAYYKKKDY